MRMVIAGLAATALGTSAPTHVARKTADYAFDYTYPAAAARIAPLRAWLNADAAELRAYVASEAASWRVESREAAFPFSPFRASRTWKVVADTPRFLSLSGETLSYLGGAHGDVRTMSLVWDKAFARRLKATDVFASPAAVQNVFGAKWCAWVLRERSDRMVHDAGKDGGVKCPPVAALTLLLGSSGGGRIDRVGLIADQYVAGSYAEGSYQTTLPVTAAVLGAVKPAYRADFAVR